MDYELALRSGFSAQARKPPTARPAPRGERLGLPELTAGPVSYFYRRQLTGQVTAPLLDERRRVLAPHRTHQADGKAEL